MPTRDRAGGSPGLFAAAEAARQLAAAPLAERMRPRTLAEFAGQAHLVGPGRLLREVVEGKRLQSLILWGPPGSGKTSLAALIAANTGAHFERFSAVLSGVRELRAVIDAARARLRERGQRTILFVDEIHRFNRAQQDAFLPHVEDGTVILVGATTENPSFEVIAPLLSRAPVVVLEPLAESDIRALLERALADPERGLGRLGLRVDRGVLDFLARHARGDARRALNVLEAAAHLALATTEGALTLAVAEEAAQQPALGYDRAGEEHYNVVSAFIKSLRGSDPDAALYWMMRMLEGGEDPLFVARRMVIFAAEDVGNADPRALQVAVAAAEALQLVGMPEGRIPLAQAATYLATAPKSNAAYAAMLAAAADVRAHGALPVPLHLRNAPTRLMADLGYGRDYRYPHDFEGHVVAQQYLPDRLRDRRYYTPSDQGVERLIRARLARWRRQTGGG